ncbi:MAG TPA: hypothetical protein VJA94_15015 [Candidatus Angelobacter sp.]
MEKDKPTNVQAETRFPGDELPTVMFDMHPSKSTSTPPDARLYDCTYEKAGKIARFRLEFKQTGPLEGDIPVARGEGRFLAVAGSDNTVLLQDLKKALDAQHLPGRSPRTAGLAFDAVVLGEKQSRDSSGGYSSNPAGDWILIKLFFPKGDDEAEVFLNLNPVLGKGEFSIKDSDYGDYLLKEFAKVL